MVNARWGAHAPSRVVFRRLAGRSDIRLLTADLCPLGDGAVAVAAADLLLAKCQHDFAEAGVGFHTLMRVANFIDRIDSVDHRTNRAA